MKKIAIIWPLFILFVFLQSCQEYDMVEYGEGGEINFMGNYYANDPDRKPYWVDEVKYLKHEINFGFKGDACREDTVIMGVKIMGIPTSNPRKLVFKTIDPEENVLKVESIGDYYVPADTGILICKILVKRPPERNKTFTTKLTFDYDQSDFKAGTLERQTFQLKAVDTVSLELWGTSMEEWELYEEYFGEYSETKIRYLIAQYDALSFPEWTAGDEIMDVLFSNGFYMDLEEYKANPENPPLIDENTGEWISFPDLWEMF